MLSQSNLVKSLKSLHISCHMVVNKLNVYQTLVCTMVGWILSWNLGMGTCHAHKHGLIHDGQLWACQSCLLGLMYVLRLLYTIRCFRVMACLGLQLVGGCIKGQALPFSCQFFQNSFVRESFFHSQIGFLDAHDDYYKATVYIHYVFFPSLQFNIHENFISASSCALYIYICACISF